MKLNQLAALLNANRDKQLLLLLPNQNPVPKSFHITEVGQIDKTFIDCGGTVHSARTCQLQAWVGDDGNHRLSAGKVVDILDAAHSLFADDNIEVEIEYEDQVISQYPIACLKASENTVLVQLTSKHTDCLAKDKCETPSPETPSCCGPNCC